MNKHLVRWLIVAALGGAALAVIFFAPEFMILVLWVLPLAVVVYWASSVHLLLREIRDEVRALRRDRDDVSQTADSAR